MPLNSLLDNQFEFIIQANQPISDIENLPYWKFEAFIERLNKRNDEIKKQRKKEDEEMKKQQSSSGVGKYNTSSFIPKFKAPKF
jgi:hypothetical protein